MSFLPCLREVQFEPVLPSFEKLWNNVWN
jgi:hypothetical protein